MSEANVELMENGPILIKGPATYVDGAGKTQQMEKPWIALCRCGHSANKPFCDGTHKPKGWQVAKGALRQAA